jgi:O-antigen/teichoic acid export membrane protein
MLKRIAVIAVLTGIGQLISVFSIKYTSQLVSPAKLSSIAHIDALVSFLLSIVALGLQLSAMRNIALKKEWKEEYGATQTARLTLGLIVFIFGSLFFIKWEYGFFFLAPLFAISGDYALYAIGKPVTGAAIACLRLAFPYSAMLLAAYFQPDIVNYVFIGSWAAVYLLTNVIIAHVLNVKSLYLPKWHSLRLYLRSLPLGIVSLSSYFLGLGLILIVPYFYPLTVETIAFVGLKFYVIYKGVLRIAHQAFFKEMMDDKWCLKIDQLSMLIALLYLSSALFFPDSFITFFFGKQYISEKYFFLLLGISAVIYSFLSSTGTRAILDKKDKPVSIITATASFITIFFTIIISYFSNNPISISVSIVIGELALMLGLAKISSIKNLVIPRLIFLLLNFFLLIIPCLFVLFFKDDLVTYIIGMLALSIALFLINFRKFTFPLKPVS